MRVLLIEDDQLLSAALVTKLTEQHYVVDAAFDGKTGWDYATGWEYDLILLDVILPELDGISLCRKLRSHHNNTPILLLTGRDNSADKVMGLDAGADDYIVKPFDFEELSARIRAILRRGSESLSPVLVWGDLCLDPSTCAVEYQQRLLNLTPKEYAILELFLRNRQRVFSCRAILDQLWALEESPTEDTVRAHIKGLRQKLKVAGAPANLIETVYGLGYRLKLEATDTPDKTQKNPNPILEQSERLESGSDPSQPQPAPVNPDHPLNHAIAKIWERFQDKISDQIQVLEQATTALERGKLQSELRVNAYRESHKLAGSLGTFGIGEGSVLARKMEELLQGETPLTPEQITHLAEWVVQLRQVLPPSTPGTPAPPASPAPTPSLPLLLIICDQGTNTPPDLITPRHPNLNIKVISSLEAATDQVIVQQLYLPNIVLLDLDTISVNRHQQEQWQNLTLEQDSLQPISPTAPLAQFLNYLSEQIPPVPVLVLTSQGDFNARVQVARLGVHTFLQKPLTCSQMLTTALNVLRQTGIHQKKVMIVDDDPTFLLTLKPLLEPLNIQTVSVSDPRQFWQILAQETPDLLVLDISMPHLNGIELCRVVRSDPRWRQLPILFLTAHTDPDTIHQAFAAGADDLITKPTSTQILITRIANRLQRTQALLSHPHNSGTPEIHPPDSGTLT